MRRAGDLFSAGSVYLPNLLSGCILNTLFWRFLELDFRVLRQNPGLEGLSVGKRPQLSFPDSPKQDYSRVRETEMLPSALCARALAYLRYVILGVDEGDFVFKKMVQILKADFARQHRIAHLGDRNLRLCGSR